MYSHVCGKILTNYVQKVKLFLLSQVKQTVGAVLINMVVSTAYNPFMCIKKILWNFNKSLPTFIQYRFP